MNNRVLNNRATAAGIINQVLHDGRSLSDCLPDALVKYKDSRDQAFIQALCYGVCRWYFRLDAILKLLLDKPLKETDRDIVSLLLVGVYQLADMRVAAHAAVAETVEATRSLKKPWAKGLVNAILRNYQRREEELNRKMVSNLSAFYSHPTWMIEKIQKSWPEDWKNILDANNQHPPFALRVNQKKISRAAYQEKLISEVIGETPSGIVLADPVSVTQLPGFDAGEISVQDGAAQLAAVLLELEPNQHVLDACAAPGGKTAHILEMQPDLAEVVALDIDPERVALIEENLSRLALSATCLIGDAGNINQEKLYDRILLDAPCSASGVIRRHPDIKLLRRSTDIQMLIAEQMRLLTSVWKVLKPGGLLVYATCSIFPEENEGVLQLFLEKNANAKEIKIAASWGKERSIGRQILPGMHGMDGFYYAKLKKEHTTDAY